MSKSLLTPKSNYGDWRDFFFEHGYAIIKNAITPERAEYYKSKQVEWLKSFNRGFDPENEDTWTSEHLPVSFKGGMYGSYCAPHERFAWEARMEPGVMNPFIHIWETEELLVSFDMFNITLPRQKDLKWSPWPHCDQDPKRKGLQCIQGLLNFAPNGDDDGGLILMDGSAKLYDQFFKETREMANHEDAPPPEANYRDLFIFKEEDVKWFEDRGCRLIKPNLGPGDLVLWDSRYVANLYAGVQEPFMLTVSRSMHYAKHPTGTQIRHAQYVCFTPVKFADPQALKEKADIFRSWGGTTHWPHTNIHPQGKAKRDGVLDPQEREEPLEKPIVTDRLLQLAAVKAY